MKKILAIQFKYFGDAVFLTPALSAIKSKFQSCELHLLVASEMAPIFNNLEYIDKIWPAPRIRGKLNLMQLLPLIHALRKVHFDYVVDFGGNDRGAIFSWLTGAKIRLGLIERYSKILQSICYTDTVDTYSLSSNYILRNLELLNAWHISTPLDTRPVIISNQSLKKQAKKVLQNKTIICHLGTSQPKKEWPLKKWQAFYLNLGSKKKLVAFSSGNSPRERALLEDFKKLQPDIFTLPMIKNLELYLAVLNEAKLVVSGDTAPLHFSYALGVKVVGLFGINGSLQYAAPIYSQSEKISSKFCSCIGDLEHFETCKSLNSCMNSIRPQQVLRLISLKK